MKTYFKPVVISILAIISSLIISCTRQKEEIPVQNLTVTVIPENTIEVSGAKVKVMDYLQLKSFKTARLDWLCNVKNISDKPARFVLNITIYDKDGFALDEFEITSNDLNPGQIQENLTSRDFRAEPSRANQLTSCKIGVTIHKTQAQIELEKEELIKRQELEKLRIEKERQQAAIQNAQRQELLRQKAEEEAARQDAEKLNLDQQKQKEAVQRQELEQKRIAEFTRAHAIWLQFKAQKENEKQQYANDKDRYSKQTEIDEQIKRVYCKLWERIEKGFTENEVETLLGKPQSVNSAIRWWDYEYFSHVKFNENGEVESWTRP